MLLTTTSPCGAVVWDCWFPERCHATPAFVIQLVPFAPLQLRDGNRWPMACDLRTQTQESQSGLVAGSGGEGMAFAVSALPVTLTGSSQNPPPRSHVLTPVRAGWSGAEGQRAAGRTARDPTASRGARSPACRARFARGQPRCAGDVPQSRAGRAAPFRASGCP